MDRTGLAPAPRAFPFLEAEVEVARITGFAKLATTAARAEGAGPVRGEGAPSDEGGESTEAAKVSFSRLYVPSLDDIPAPQLDLRKNRPLMPLSMRGYGLSG